MAKRRKTPWEKPDPKPPRARRELTPAQKDEARTAARKAGRRYPNLVDNMQVAAKANRQGQRSDRSAGGKAEAKSSMSSRAKGSPAKSKASSSNSTGRRAAKDATKDPHGGLTAKGREAFKRRDGSHLEPGVRKAEGDMSPDEMRRKGSWAARFYGRRGPLPPLQDKHGEPTRFALSAAAWGERVPRTQAEARRIAEKGRKVLDRYNRETDQGSTGKRPSATVGRRRGISSKTRSARRA